MQADGSSRFRRTLLKTVALRRQKIDGCDLAKVSQSGTQTRPLNRFGQHAWRIYASLTFDPVEN